MGAVPGKSAQGGDMGRSVIGWEVGAKKRMQDSLIPGVGTQGGVCEDGGGG